MDLGGRDPNHVLAAPFSVSGKARHLISPENSCRVIWALNVSRCSKGSFNLLYISIWETLNLGGKRGGHVLCTLWKVGVVRWATYPWRMKHPSETTDASYASGSMLLLIYEGHTFIVIIPQTAPLLMLCFVSQTTDASYASYILANIFTKTLFITWFITIRDKLNLVFTTLGLMGRVKDNLLATDKNRQNSSLLKKLQYSQVKKESFQ